MQEPHKSLWGVDIWHFDNYPGVNENHFFFLPSVTRPWHQSDLWTLVPEYEKKNFPSTMRALAERTLLSMKFILTDPQWVRHNIGSTLTWDRRKTDKWIRCCKRASFGHPLSHGPQRPGRRTGYEDFGLTIDCWVMLLLKMFTPTADRWHIEISASWFFFFFFYCGPQSRVLADSHLWKT